jgi:hypothetical protein
MIGVGRIFDSYRQGLIEDDDEVAVQHGPAELGYPAVTEAMVNIRATIDLAMAGGVLDAAAAATMRMAAKSLFYKDRTWEAIMAAAALPPDRASAFKDWCRASSVNVKQQDAQELVRVMQSADYAALRSGLPRFTFVRTVYWRSLERRIALSSQTPR